MSDDESRLAERLERLEHQVALLSEHVGLAFDDGTEGVPDDVVALARSGRRVEAIKLYGTRTGADISTATSIVNAIV